LRQINLKQTNAGQLIVGISEHATYWNNLGWSDPYSSEVFTDRQSVYASRLSAEGSYTPQMVLNGRDQFVGSDGAALERALRDGVRREHFDLRIVSSTPTARGVDVKFALTGNPTRALDVIGVGAATRNDSTLAIHGNAPAWLLIVGAQRRPLRSFSVLLTNCSLRRTASTATGRSRPAWDFIT